MQVPAHKNEAREGNYVFVIGDDRELSLSVQTSNVAGVNFGETIFATRYKEVVVPSNKVDMEPLVCDFLLSEDYSEWIEIYKWMMVCKNSNNPIIDYTKNCTLITLDSHSREGTKFHYTDVYPSNLSGIQQTTNTDNSPVLTFNVTFAYNKFSIETSSGTIIDEDYIK